MDRSASLYLLLLLSLSTTCLSQPRKKTCPRMCGNLTVDYPFGIGKPECYLQGFQILCPEKNPVPVLAALNLSVNEININGKIVLQKQGLMAFECLNQTNKNAEVCLNLSPPFTISARSNRFMAIGCDSRAYVTNNRSFNSSCETHWTRSQGRGGGLGHCQTALPEGATGFCYRVTTVNNYTDCASSTRCSFATLVSTQTAFRNESELLALTRPQAVAATHSFVADWAVESKDCPCGPNTRCNVSTRGHGFLCECMKGFSGNPYLNETGSCGSHEVPFPSATVAIVGGFVLVATFAAGSYTYNIYYPSSEGSTVPAPDASGASKGPRTPTLEDLTRIIKVCSLSQKFYDMMRRLQEKGPLVEYKPLIVENTSQIQPFMREFNAFRLWIRHPNVVRPLKCNLSEKIAVEDAMLVYYKFYEHTLYHRLHSVDASNNGSGGGGAGDGEDGGSNKERAAVEVARMPWKDRLRVAVGTARALACAHSQGFMHRDVRSSNILLDEKHNAKVIQFGLAMLLTPETYMNERKGYLDPEFMETKALTYKSDVYAFGVLLVELLTGKDPSLEEDGEKEGHGLVTRFMLSTDDEIDVTILNEISRDELNKESKMDQLTKVVRVAEACLQEGDVRPSMSEVVVHLDSALEVSPDMDLNDNMYEDLKKEAFDISMDLAAESEKTVQEAGGKTVYELLTGS